MHPGSAAHAALTWLDARAGAVQAVPAFILTAITASYAWLTKKLLNQAETSAGAAGQAETHLNAAMQILQHAEKLLPGPAAFCLI